MERCSKCTMKVDQVRRKHVHAEHGHSIDMSRVELPMMFNLHHPLNLEVIGAEAQHDNMQSAAYRVIWGFPSEVPGIQSALLYL